ncbi:MAG: type II toxin-antitoxin system PemK/MazF family toxin [Candidatus Tectomicrobia bacterium]|uniref:Type II toxin-antitoxin system PemK/MazF family toxin n=1 Tax=Tectimicrobiota bacterium TaxID=2528274 RepID=A0A937W4H5_UNCTE|nr:type II toxin-antitoxin system PemK/MazF family toxin [Candidatus Tectomicrobia bacterium]
MRRGDVRWYRFAQPDKRRPVVVLTRDSIIEYLGEVTVAPVTSTIRDIPSEVLLSPHDGMPGDCAINLDHVHTVAKGRVGALITTLSVEKMVQLRRALLFALGFGD